VTRVDLVLVGSFLSGLGQGGLLACCGFIPGPQRRGLLNRDIFGACPLILRSSLVWRQHPPNINPGAGLAIGPWPAACADPPTFWRWGDHEIRHFRPCGFPLGPQFLFMVRRSRPQRGGPLFFFGTSPDYVIAALIFGTGSLHDSSFCLSPLVFIPLGQYHFVVNRNNFFPYTTNPS